MTHKCLICKNELPNSVTKRGGRPTEMHPQCKEFRNRFDQMTRALEAIEFATPEARKVIEGDFFALTQAMRSPKKAKTPAQGS